MYVNNTLFRFSLLTFIFRINFEMQLNEMERIKMASTFSLFHTDLKMNWIFFNFLINDIALAMERHKWCHNYKFVFADVFVSLSQFYFQFLLTIIFWLTEKENSNYLKWLKRFAFVFLFFWSKYAKQILIKYILYIYLWIDFFHPHPHILIREINSICVMDRLYSKYSTVFMNANIHKTLFIV